MMRQRPLAVLAIVMLAGAVVLAREDIRIQPSASKTRVLAAFTAKDAWTQGIREILQQGHEVTFEFDAELRRPGSFLFFGVLDRLLAQTRVSSSAKYDTLSGDYKVNRMRNGTVFVSDRRDKEADVREWLTNIDQVALDPVTPLEPNGDYYVRVALVIRPRRITSLWSIVPVGRPDDSGRKDFTFVR